MFKSTDILVTPGIGGPSKPYQEVALEDTPYRETTFREAWRPEKGGPSFFFCIFHKQKLGFFDAFFISTLFPGFRL
jgi:hypothetical protein